MKESIHLEEWIQHYDNLMWVISSILLTANILLIGAFFQMGESLIKSLFPILGVLLILLTIYFACSFRRLRHLYQLEYAKRLNEKDQEFNKLLGSNKILQWFTYVFSFGLIGFFWILISWISHSKSCPLIHLLGLFIFIQILIILYKIGDFKTSEDIFNKRELFNLKKRVKKLEKKK